MWKRVPLDDNKQYILNLCQDSEQRRFCALTELGHEHPHAVGTTSVIPIELLRKNAWGEISSHFPLLPYNIKFLFGPHGEWLTEQENHAIETEGFSSVPWITAHPPRFPPK